MQRKCISAADLNKNWERDAVRRHRSICRRKGVLRRSNGAEITARQAYACVGRRILTGTLTRALGGMFCARDDVVCTEAVDHRPTFGTAAPGRSRRLSIPILAVDFCWRSQTANRSAFNTRRIATKHSEWPRVVQIFFGNHHRTSRERDPKPTFSGFFPSTQPELRCAGN